MIALYVIAGLLVLIFILLCMPLELCADINRDEGVYLKYLFFKFPFNNEAKEEEKEEKKPQPSKKPKPKSKKKKENKLKKFKTLYNTYFELIKLFFGEFGELLRHVVIKVIDIKILVSGDDASDTAVKYGVVCSGIYPLVSMIEQRFAVKSKNIDVSTDFNGAEPEFSARIKLFIRPVFVVSGVISLLRIYTNYKKRKGV